MPNRICNLHSFFAFFIFIANKKKASPDHGPPFTSLCSAPLISQAPHTLAYGMHADTCTIST